MHDPKDIESITKRLYNEQRGRVHGNTKEWERLSVHLQLRLMANMDDLIDDMKEIW